jgi:hypothetical protein
MTSKQIIPDHSNHGAPIPGIYKHYKGNLYQVLGLVRHSETEEWLVVYQALYGEKGFWVRPLTLWLEPVRNDAETVTNKNALPAMRFELVDANNTSLAELTQHS